MIVIDINIINKIFKLVKIIITNIEEAIIYQKYRIIQYSQYKVFLIIVCNL